MAIENKTKWKADCFFLFAESNECNGNARQRHTNYVCGTTIWSAHHEMYNQIHLALIMDYYYDTLIPTVLLKVSLALSPSLSLSLPLSLPHSLSSPVPVSERRAYDLYGASVWQADRATHIWRRKA